MRKSGAFLLSIILIIMLSGCGGNGDQGDLTSASTKAGTNSESSETESKDKEEAGQVKLFYDNAAWTDYLKELNPITKKNDNIEFEAVPYNEPASFQTAIRVGFTTDDAADVFKWWNGFQMKELVDAGYLADMTEQWKQMTADGVDPSTANTLTFDGKTYGIPAGVHYWVMYYNKKIFEENGLQPPKTWEEFLHIADTLKAKGIKAFGQSTTDVWNGFIWFEEMLIHSNPEFYDKLVVGEAKYTDPEAVEAMKTWKNLYDQDYFAKPLDWNTEVGPAMAKGEFAMFLMGTWYADYFKSAGMKPGEDFGMFVLPAIKPEAGNTVISEVTPFLVSEKSKNKENAINALVALTKKEANEKMLSLYGGVPIRGDIVSDDPVIKGLSEEIGSGGYKTITRFWEATPSELSEYASSEFIRFMLNPDQYEKVLNNIQKKADKYWAEH